MTPTQIDVRRIVANPYYCLRNWRPGVDVHEPIVTEELWIKAAKAMIKSDGAEVFLRELLENLKGNWVPSEPLQPMPKSEE